MTRIEKRKNVFYIIAHLIWKFHDDSCTAVAVSRNAAMTTNIKTNKVDPEQHLFGYHTGI